MISILIIMSMDIRLTKFLKAGILKIVFNIDRKILERLVFIKKIYTKVIVNRYINLNWDYYYKFKAIYIFNYKNNMIKIEKKDLKTKANQLKNKK